MDRTFLSEPIRDQFLSIAVRVLLRLTQHKPDTATPSAKRRDFGAFSLSKAAFGAQNAVQVMLNVSRGDIKCQMDLTRTGEDFALQSMASMFHIVSGPIECCSLLG